MSYVTVTFLTLDLSLKITQLKVFAQLRYSFSATQPWTFINILVPNVNYSGRAVGPLNSRTATEVAAQWAL